MVQHITAKEMRDEELQPWIDDFNRLLGDQLDCTNFEITADIDFDSPLDIYNVQQKGNEVAKLIDKVDDIEFHDNLIGATFLLNPFSNPKNGGSKARVIRQKMDATGEPLGNAHSNLLNNTVSYWS